MTNTSEFSEGKITVRPFVTKPFKVKWWTSNVCFFIGVKGNISLKYISNVYYIKA
jgi:hypothetical protein